jgi:hypothetical protein
VGQHGHRGPVEVAEARARAHGGDAGGLRVVHERVEVSLQRAERAGHRQRPGHVGGVERPVLDAHVEQQQLTRAYGTVVLDPVQRRRVRAAGDDRRVATSLPSRPRATPERALDPALAELDRPGHVGDDIGEAALGDGDRVLELLDLPRVLDQPQLGQDRCQLAVADVVAADERVDRGVDTTSYARRHRPAQGSRQLLDVPRADRVRVGDLGQRRPPTRPELTEPAVAPELRTRRAVGAGAAGTARRRARWCPAAPGPAPRRTSATR